MTKSVRVAILGGGVAGLATAHHLLAANHVEDNTVSYDITVFDAAPEFGGKCRSFRSDDDLAGEHGFRFFPGFYRYITHTLKQIVVDTDSGTTVLDRLVALEEAGFYAEASGDSERVLKLRLDQATTSLHWVSGNRWLRWIGTLALLVLAGFIGRGGWAIFVLLLAVVWFNLRVLSAVGWMQFQLRGRIPREVRPRLFESIWMFLLVAQIATSSRRRMVQQRDEQSWWAFVQAWRRSDAFRLTLASGLTRSFVATRAEQMSARTGGAILAQLLYDINPYLGGPDPKEKKDPADRVLNAPTSEAWIKPWVQQLRDNGVKFNQLDDAAKALWANGSGPLIQSLKVGEGDDGTPEIIGFGYGIPDPTSNQPRSNINDPRSSEQRSEVETITGFDEYVLALSGTAAQQVLANSPELLDFDRAERQPEHEMNAHTEPSTLAGVFSLEFGWMSGVVFHFDKPLPALPKGHILCLESEFALTILDQQPHWPAEQNPSGSILSVNLSDWFTPAKDGLPARYRTLDDIAVEVWRQIVAHIPSLESQKPIRSKVLFDKAIADPQDTIHGVTTIDGRISPGNASRLDLARRQRSIPLQDPADAANHLPSLPIEIARTLGFDRPDAGGSMPPSLLVAGLRENMALSNGERLLINTARSWANRPTTTTSLHNLYVAGDYVRTYSDFASMEAADESARWAALAIWKNHGDQPPSCFLSPSDLEVPHELHNVINSLRWVDKRLSRLGLPHLLGLFSGPIGFLARVENLLRPSRRQR